MTKSVDCPNGAIMWLTGLSGAGKTTLGTALVSDIQARNLQVALLDGDMLRRGLCRGLGYSDEDRAEHVRRAGEVALLLAATGQLVVVTLISPFREGRLAVAQRCIDSNIAFAEVFVNAPLEVC